MKVSKTFRLSPEAVAKLDEQDNATQYLEDLILGSGQKAPQVVTIQQLETLLEPIKQAISIKQKESMVADSRPTAWSTIRDFPKEFSIPSEPAKHNLQDILEEIRTTELNRDSELEYCQDELLAKKIFNGYQKDIDLLWSKYNELKKDTNG